MRMAADDRVHTVIDQPAGEFPLPLGYSHRVLVAPVDKSENERGAGPGCDGRRGWVMYSAMGGAQAEAFRRLPWEGSA